MRTLVVARHAKAVREAGQRDEDRPLAGRGERDAAAAGVWLHEAGLLPQRVLCSTSRRTRQTWEGVRGGLGGLGEAVVSYEERLYRAEAGDLLELVRQTPGEVDLLLVVAHNPAAHQCAVGLTGGPILSFPTAALAVIDLPGEWRQAAPGRGRLAQFWAPGRDGAL